MPGLLRHPKQRGELAELAFLHKAASLGFTVSKPYGDSASYDFIVDTRRTLPRVQVKSAHRLQTSGYHVSTHQNRRCYQQVYSAAETDFIAAYIAPVNAWYIIPVEILNRRKTICVYPHRPASDRLFGSFREAWHLLSRGGPRLQPSGGSTGF